VRAAALIPAALCAVWTVLAGKDVNWDLLNYHYYLGYELIGDRLNQDFFAASAQSYLNPVGYLPFYLLASSWHSVAASVTLAIVHGVSLTLLYHIARCVFAHLPPREQLEFSLLGTALGAATAVFWPMVGSSFLDPLLLPLMLAGLLLLMRARPALAGALFGAAAALKYSNVVYVLAALPFLIGLRAALVYALAATLAIALFAGPWLVALWREFGNPVFPLMNAWFQSPHAPAVNLSGQRFAPADLWHALLLPFRMVALDRHLYSETFAPDVRFAALAAAAVASPFIRRGALRALDCRLFGFLAIAVMLWLSSSANARYGLPVLMVAGVVLARLVERLLPMRAARTTLVVIIALQVAVSIVAAPARWFLAEPWSTRWLPYEAPERARREPALYLSVEMLPMAAVAPFLHPASSFVNFSGQHSLPPDAPRLATLLERHRGHVRALGRRAEPAFYDAALRRLGYKVDAQDCFTIAWHPEYDNLASAANFLARVPPSEEPLSVVSCALVAAPRDAADAAAERRMSAVFDRIERSCPLLHGQTAVTEPFGASGWMRHYNGIDARLEAFGGGVLLERLRNGELVDLGRLADWARDAAPLPAPCR